MREEDTMTKVLSEAAVRQYNERGYYAPIPVLSTVGALDLRTKLETFEADAGPLAGRIRQKSHLLFTWLADLVRHPAILDAVEDVLGPDLLCWGSSFFIKNPHDPGFVSWHQDSTYWGLDPADVMTAWIAISDSTPENGAMRVIPGTHLMDQIPHRDTFRKENLLSRGQEVMVDVDERQSVTLELNAGEMSLHHVRLIHGSAPNPSGKRRIGYAIRYIPTTVRQVAGSHDSATLVRGTDRYGHFELEQRPDADMSAAAMAHHAAVTGAHTAILMRETGREMRA
jgi:ectoine hydroxylase-related dioxygenase (phytanoyl-CoA dioxygenase family)